MYKGDSTEVLRVPAVCNMKRHLFRFCCLVALGGFIYRYLTLNSDKYITPKICPHHKTTAPPTSAPTINPKFEEYLQLIEWPEPPSTVKHLNFSTSEKKSEYHVWNPRDTYKVGETLEVVITARDHNGHLKGYGGDFFRVKLHNPTLKAGVTGQVKDYNNGSYLVSFLLPWPGEAQIHITLVYSSEAVAILKEKRENYPEKIFFVGYFNGSSEVVECNLEIKGKDVCKYRDPVSGNSWECVRPKSFPCEFWTHHNYGNARNVTNYLEDSILRNSVTLQPIPGSVPSIKVMSDDSSMGLTSNLPPCGPGLEPPKPSGFYYNDTWVSLTCSGRHFPLPADALACLKGKDIHMVADSTVLQWFTYLHGFIPSLKWIKLRNAYLTGLLLAVDPSAGLVIRYRTHGLPLITEKTLVADLPYDAAELAGIGGGPQTIVVINLWAHFASYPVMVYLQRLEKVRRAVEALLLRSPQTTVIIKSANTGRKSVQSNDWLFLQLDIIMRAFFKGMAVSIIDAWDMTSCHHSPIEIHPSREVVRNEVDLLLSYICPK